MAANGEVELVWADDQHKFNIAKIGQLLELEDKCGSGIAEIFGRLRDSRWKINDIRETVRLGLVGAGMEPTKALLLVQRYVDDRPLTESLQVAVVILMAALVGVPKDDVGKKEKAERAEETQSSEATAGSSAPPSTVLEQPLDGHQDKQMN